VEWGAEPVDGPLHGLRFAIKDNIDLIGYPTTADVDALLLPVTPGHPTLAAVAADPIRVNARLGTFTNFANLLDLCAVAVPAGQHDDGLPFGVQLIAPAFADRPVELDDGAVVSGFLAPESAVAGAEDVTRFGGWRAYLSSSI
jgi:Asp-tRNA(Asn)/Glu-tRNA(Gln) amidotransferase A subunit family amidase